MDMFTLHRLAEAQAADPYGTYFNNTVSLPSVFNNPFVLRPTVTPQPLTRPATQITQPAQPKAEDLIGDFLALAWNVVIKAREPQWKKDSPNSLAIYKLSDGLAGSPSITAEGKKWLNVIKGVAFLYGLDQSNH